MRPATLRASHSPRARKYDVRHSPAGHGLHTPPWQTSDDSDYTLHGDIDDAEFESAADTPSAWSNIESYFRRHDVGMIQDLDDDINTLLVFVTGLFSAIVTAFVIESYQWFEEDDTHTSAVLLGRISSQLDEMVQNSSGSDVQRMSVHSSAPGQPQAETMQVLVNTLWFLALILGVGAALFGMIAKQWLREYLRWTALSLPPRELVRLRQLRYDAWKTWRTASIITAIPILLEVALILFVSGVVTLLWTLNHTVAWVITVAASLLFVTAFALMLLPVWYLRCPYRSSTGWAFLSLSWAVSSAWNRFHGTIEHLLRRATVGRDTQFHVWWDSLRSTHRFAESWHERDLQLDVLSLSRLHMWPKFSELHASWHGDMSLTQNIVEISVLSRALAWVRKSSQEDTLLRDVRRCISVLPRTSSVPHRIVVALYTISRTVGMQMELFMQSLERHYERRVISDVAPTEECYALVPWSPQLAEDPLSTNIRSIKEPMLLIILDLLWQNARHIMSLMMDGDELLEPLVMESCVQSLCLLRVLRRHSMSQATKEHYQYLADAYMTFTPNASRYQGLKTFLLNMLCDRGRVTLKRRKLNVQPSMTMVCTDTALLSIELFRQNRHYEDKEDCHSFVTLTSSALEGLLHRYLWRTMWHSAAVRPALERTVSGLLGCMEEAVRISNQRRWRNCGSYHALRWVKYLILGCKTHPSFLRLVPPTLVQELAFAHEEGLIDIHGDSSIDFAELLGFLSTSLRVPKCDLIASPAPTAAYQMYELPIPEPDTARTHDPPECSTRSYSITQSPRSSS